MNHHEEPTKRDDITSKADTTPQRYATIREVFLSVYELPLLEQVKALDRACDGDRDLRIQVDELLALDRTAERILSRLRRYG